MAIVLNIHRDGTSFVMGDTQSTVLVSPANGSKYVTFNYIRYAPHAEFPQHVHDHSEDVFLVLEGDGWLRRGDERTPIGHGDVIFVPPGEQHGTIAGPNGMAVVSCQGPPDTLLYTGERDSTRPPSAPSSPPLSATKQTGLALLFAVLFAALTIGFIWLQARPDPDALHRKGLAALEARDYDGAIALLTRCLELNDQHAGARETRGQAYEGKRDYSAAIRDYNDVIRLKRRAPGAYFGRGLCHVALGEYDQAIADLHEAVRLAPKWADAFDCRGYVFGCRKEYLHAVADYNQARSSIRTTSAHAWAGRRSTFRRSATIAPWRISTACCCWTGGTKAASSAAVWFIANSSNPSGPSPIFSRPSPAIPRRRMGATTWPGCSPPTRSLTSATGSRPSNTPAAPVS